jgi:hypothetical protein
VNLRWRSFQHVVDHMDERADWQSDLFSISGRCCSRPAGRAAVPGQAPVVAVGSGFGVGRTRSPALCFALGLDFPSPGTIGRRGDATTRVNTARR